MSKPQQPIIKDEQGVVRFRENAIVRVLLERHGKTLEQVLKEDAFIEEDRDQCAQLLGYTVDQFVALVGCGVEDNRFDEIRAQIANPKSPAKRGYDPQPMQPIYETDKGTIRFRQNTIVDVLLDHDTERGRRYPQFAARSDGGLNWIATQRFSQADQEQLAQLIGYSISGYHELSYVSNASAEEASMRARAIMPGAGGCRDKGCPYHGGPLTDAQADDGAAPS